MGHSYAFIFTRLSIKIILQMKTIRNFIFFLFILASCNPAQKTKNKLEKLNEFVLGVESGSSSFKESDWVRADSTLNEYITFFDNNQYN